MKTPPAAPAHTGHTVSGGSIAALLGYVGSRGANLDDDVLRAGLDASTLLQPDLRISQELNNLLWERAAAAVDDNDFGLHFAEHFDLDAFHVLGHLAASSDTLGQAIERIVAFSRLLHDAGRTELEVHGGEARVFPGCRGLPEPPPRHVADFSAASVVLLARMITGQPCTPLAVHFNHSPPPSTREHLRIFGVMPSWKAAETVVVLPAAALALPIKDARPAVSLWLQGYARELLARLPADDSLVAKVTRAIVTGIPRGAAEIGPVAAQLGLTPRTLQRRLAALSTSFAALGDEARRLSAEQYLRDERLPLAEVAFLLGFQEPSAFHKAFRRWTGTTPGAWRASAVGA